MLLRSRSDINYFPLRSGRLHHEIIGTRVLDTFQYCCLRQVRTSIRLEAIIHYPAANIVVLDMLWRGAIEKYPLSSACSRRLKISKSRVEGGKDNCPIVDLLAIVCGEDGSLPLTNMHTIISTSIAVQPSGIPPRRGYFSDETISRTKKTVGGRKNPSIDRSPQNVSNGRHTTVHSQ